MDENNIIPLENMPITANMVSIESNRAIQEVQASLIIAKRFPRSESIAEEKILKDCTRPALAEQAVYEYPRGGQTVTGPSIRLAEVMKRAWGNIESGWRELERRGDTSIIQAYAWDKESNVKEERIFSVKQSRDKWSKNQQGKAIKIQEVLKDERDIYENNANMAARRVRACILALIPGDIVDAAVKQCEATMIINEKVTQDSINKLTKCFETYKVTKEMLTEYVGRNLTPEALSPAMMVKLRGVFKSLQDGVGKVDDFFTIIEEEKPEAKAEEKKDKIEAFKDKNKVSKKENTQLELEGETK